MLFWPLTLTSSPYCSIQDPNSYQYFMWNKSFDTPEYFYLEISPYLLNTPTIAGLKHLFCGTPGLDSLLEVGVIFYPFYF
jgi:hypothetical protein